MRHYAGVKAILCLPLFFVACASADEAADRVAIGRAIATLNELPRPTALFTEDANASTELEWLPKVNPLAFRMAAFRNRPTVTISHEPWGEATINFPWTDYLIKAFGRGRWKSSTPGLGAAPSGFSRPM